MVVDCCSAGDGFSCQPFVEGCQGCAQVFGQRQNAGVWHCQCGSGSDRGQVFGGGIAGWCQGYAGLGEFFSGCGLMTGFCWSDQDFCHGQRVQRDTVLAVSQHDVLGGPVVDVVGGGQGDDDVRVRDDHASHPDLTSSRYPSG